MVILTIPLFNKEEFYGALPLPTQQNTGGFVFPSGTSNLGTYSMYSPIDLAVASLIKPTKKIKNLKEWFAKNPKRTNENYIYITYRYKDSVYSESITEIKNRIFTKSEWAIFKKIAPFTFKE